VDFSLIDGFTKQIKMLQFIQRKMALEEGSIFLLVIQLVLALRIITAIKEHSKPEDVVVVLFHDSGSRYVSQNV
jgi:cystathionine beta-synthase